MNFKTTALAAAVGVVFATQAMAQATQIHVSKTNGCGCCLAWMEHLGNNGFAPTGKDLFSGALARYKFESGVPQQMVACHTAKVDGYVIEGHVPAADIRKLLAERPDAVGLAVPGMPMGSPGMDFGSDRDAYDVYLIKADGGTEVFTSYSGN